LTPEIIPTSTCWPSPTPPSGQYGNAGRDTIPGPFQFGLNAALNRAFRFGDTRRTLQFRLSTSNALNHVAITSFGTTVNSSTFGLATAASATRSVVTAAEVQLLVMRIVAIVVLLALSAAARRNRTRSSLQQQSGHRRCHGQGQIRQGDRRP